MICDEVTELLIDYIEGELPRRQTQDIQHHLETCDKCRQEAQLFEQTLDSLVDTSDDPGDGYFANIFPRVMQRIEQGEALPWYRRFFFGKHAVRNWSLAGAPMAAAVVLFIVTAFPSLLTTAPIAPDNEPALTAVQPMIVRPTVMPGHVAVASFDGMSENEVEQLHTALMAALENAIADESGAGIYNARAFFQPEPGFGPMGIQALDTDQMGLVLERLSTTDQPHQ